MRRLAAQCLPLFNFSGVGVYAFWLNVLQFENGSYQIYRLCPQIRVTRKSGMKVVAFQATAIRYFA